MRIGDSSEYDFSTPRRAKYIFCKMCQSSQSTILKQCQKNKFLTQQNRRLQLKIKMHNINYKGTKQ